MESKNCSLCGIKLRNKPDAITYQVGICHGCIQNDSRCDSLRKELNNQRKKVYYSKNKEKEKARSREIYARKKASI